MTYSASSLSFRSVKVGRELFNAVRPLWRSDGSVKFCSAERSGTGIVGTGIFGMKEGRALLIPLIVADSAEEAAEMSL